MAFGGPEAGPLAFALGVVLALGAGALAGLLMGLVIAFTGAHPILVSLSMMIFLRGLGEFLTRGGDISGFPAFVAPLGQGTLLGVPVPLKHLDGMDSLLSIVQMPAGVPVATVSIGGARNAGLLAARILGAGDSDEARRIAAQMAHFQTTLRDEAHAKGEALRREVAERQA